MWPKVTRGVQSLGDLTAKEDGAALSPGDIFDILSDRSRAADESLPNTGVGSELERILSPLFIVSPVYGTRSSTVLLVDKEETVTFVERTFAPGADGHAEDVSYRFMIRREP